jgi:hypothetical protein
MKTLFLLLSLCAQLAFAESERPLVRSAAVSEIEYRAYLLSEPQYFAVSRALLTERPTADKARELRERYEEAERTYISADLLKAHSVFLQVTELAFQDDWSAAQRAMIFHAYLRAAQTAQNPELRQNLLRDAGRFDFKNKIDEKLFPPPLVEEFKIIKSEETLVPVTLSRAFAPFSYALLNGETIDLKKFVLRVPAGDFRLTLISDSLKPVTQVLTASQLKLWQPSHEFFATGTCETPVITNGIPNRAETLYEHDCIVNKSKIATATPTLIEQTLQNREPYLRDKNNPTKRTEFYKNKWLWGAIGVVAAVIAIDQNHDRGNGRGTTEPTVKEGF